MLFAHPTTHHAKIAIFLHPNELYKRFLQNHPFFSLKTAHSPYTPPLSVRSVVPAVPIVWIVFLYQQAALKQHNQPYLFIFAITLFYCPKTLQVRIKTNNFAPGKY